MGGSNGLPPVMCPAKQNWDSNAFSKLGDSFSRPGYEKNHSDIIYKKNLRVLELFFASAMGENVH